MGVLALMLGVPVLMFSDFFGLDAGGSPKGDRKRRAQKNRRPDFEARMLQGHAIRMADNCDWLM